MPATESYQQEIETILQRSCIKTSGLTYTESIKKCFECLKLLSAYKNKLETSDYLRLENKIYSAIHNNLENNAEEDRSICLESSMVF